MRLLVRAAVLASLLIMASAAARGADGSAVEAVGVADLLATGDYTALRQLGAAAIPELVAIYSGDADPQRRRRVATAFYVLGVPSPDAERVLLADFEHPDRDLRIQVHYALGRVSADERILDLLVGAMRDDPDALVRDKAACALAYDQIHLDERQKVKLFAGLVQSLDDPNPQVRRIAAKALKIHTGQSRGYRAADPPAARGQAIVRWQRWLHDYRTSL